MAIRDFLVFQAAMMTALGASTLLVGCVAEPAATNAPAAAPSYRAPAEIRPPDLVIKPVPAPRVETPVESAAVPGPVTAWSPSSKARPWKYIVIHHSATSNGNAVKFDREHKAKGWDELGYHFVINNGNGGVDGRVEVGPRWPKQKWGAHAKTPDNRFNEFGIGICFVGNFQDAQPTFKQMQSGARLVAWLMKTYKIPASNVIGHDDAKATLCPGKNLNLAQIRTLANRAVADAGDAVDSLVTEPIDVVAAEPQESESPNARLAAGETDHVELLRSR
jgi:hypothetical protein